MAYMHYKSASYFSDKIKTKRKRERTGRGGLKEKDGEKEKERGRRRGREGAGGKLSPVSQPARAATVLLWMLSPVQQVATPKMSKRMISIMLFPSVLSTVICSKSLVLVPVYDAVSTDWNMLIKCKSAAYPLAVKFLCANIIG